MAQLSGQITVTTSGTAVQGPSSPSGRFFALKAHPDNSGVIWVGNDGNDDVDSTTGFPLEPGEGCIMDVWALFATPNDPALEPLSYLWFDSSKNGGKCTWMRLG